MKHRVWNFISPSEVYVGYACPVYEYVIDTDTLTKKANPTWGSDGIISPQGLARGTNCLIAYDPILNKYYMNGCKSTYTGSFPYYTGDWNIAVFDSNMDFEGWLYETNPTGYGASECGSIIYSSKSNCLYVAPNFGTIRIGKDSGGEYESPTYPFVGSGYDEGGLLFEIS
jgi:hypothetical protein